MNDPISLFDFVVEEIHEVLIANTRTAIIIQIAHFVVLVLEVDGG